MADQKKKPYTKPEIRAQKIELGVYGDYNADGGDVTTPLLPVRDKDQGGDVRPEG
jgi:hypothetical protein